MNSLLPLLLHWLHVYGYPMLWLIVFVAAVGLPLPTSLVLLAAGAFAGRDDFNIVLLMGITITASSCGDNVGYFIGRRWGSGTLQWLGKPRRRHLIPFHTITRSRLYFKRKGGWAIFFSRFLFSTLGGVMNLLAGADRYPYRRFLLYDVTGETLGAVIPLSLGYAFGACWEAGDNLLGAFSGFALVLFVVILLARRLVRTLLHSRETLAAEPAMSAQKLTVDTTPPENTPRCITGARRENMGEQRQEVLDLEEKIEEYKAFLRDFQRLMGPEWLEQRPCKNGCWRGQYFFLQQASLPLCGIRNSPAPVFAWSPTSPPPSPKNLLVRDNRYWAAYARRSRTAGNTSLASRLRWMVASPTGHTFKKVKPCRTMVANCPATFLALPAMRHLFVTAPSSTRIGMLYPYVISSGFRPACCATARMCSPF